MYCPRCGSPIVQDAASCARCGLVFTAARQYTPKPFPPPPKPPAGSMIAIGVLMAVLVLLSVPLMILVFAEDLGDDESARPPATVTSSSPVPSSRTPTGVPNPREEVVDTGEVRELSAGLLCRDLRVGRYSYLAAVDYWRQHGRPAEMTDERYGIPCETDYPASDVRAYWGTARNVTPNHVGVETLLGGLSCQDMRDRGYTYGQTLDYWAIGGYPDRMDEDLNGIPCETVFPWVEVIYYWYG